MKNNLFTVVHHRTTLLESKDIFLSSKELASLLQKTIEIGSSDAIIMHKKIWEIFRRDSVHTTFENYAVVYTADQFAQISGPYIVDSLDDAIFAAKYFLQAKNILFVGSRAMAQALVSSKENQLSQPKTYSMNENKNMNQDQIKTDKQFDTVVATCRPTFVKKMEDYGAAWRIYRSESLLDQLYIKAKRIRTIQENKGKQLVNEKGDDIPSEFAGILNYAIMGLLQMQYPATVVPEEDAARFVRDYDTAIADIKSLMQKKNHDYGEAWREMSQVSFIDMILTKIFRLRQIHMNNGMVNVSEGSDAIYMDIVNYCIFALIQLQDSKYNDET